MSEHIAPPAFHIQDARICVPLLFLETSVRPWIFHYNTRQYYEYTLSLKVQNFQNQKNVEISDNPATPLVTIAAKSSD